MFSDDLPINPQWRKPSKCDNSGPNCAEFMNVDGDVVQFRNSQRPDTMLSFDRGEWTSFIEAAKAGEFDI